jgi:hypothetical protein
MMPDKMWRMGKKIVFDHRSWVTQLFGFSIDDEQAYLWAGVRNPEM